MLTLREAIQKHGGAKSDFYDEGKIFQHLIHTEAGEEVLAGMGLVPLKQYIDKMKQWAIDAEDYESLSKWVFRVSVMTDDYERYGNTFADEDHIDDPNYWHAHTDDTAVYQLKKLLDRDIAEVPDMIKKELVALELLGKEE